MSSRNIERKTNGNTQLAAGSMRARRKERKKRQTHRIWIKTQKRNEKGFKSLNLLLYIFFVFVYIFLRISRLAIILCGSFSWIIVIIKWCRWYPRAHQHQQSSMVSRETSISHLISTFLFYVCKTPSNYIKHERVPRFFLCLARNINRLE